MDLLKKWKTKETNTWVASYEWRQTPSFLWRVFVIAGEEIWLEKTVVAASSEDAQFKAGVPEVLKEKDRKPSTVTIKTFPIANLNETEVEKNKK